MPRYSVSRNNFLGGELSKRADGRSDLAQYQLGCKQLENFVVMPDGGVTKRPGSRFAAIAKGASGKTITGARQFPFVYSNTEIYKVIIWTADDGTVNYTIINADTLAAATVIVDADVSQNCTTVLTNEPNGENIVFNLENLQYTQSADVMTFCGAGIRPFCVFRTARKNLPAEATFHVADYLEGSGFGANDNVKIERMPFRDENVTSITMAPSVTSGNGTLTASAGHFYPSHVGAYFRLKHGSTMGYCKVTSYVSPLVVNITVLNNFGATTAVAAWAEGAWSGRYGYPRAITYYNRRLAFGGSLLQPDTFWLSQVSDYFQFEPTGSGVSDAMNFTLSPDNGRVNLIQWMVGGKKLSIGTISEEHVGVVQEDGTNLNVQFSSETAHGSAYIQPRRVAYAIPFVQNSNHRIRELVFNFDSDSYVANDLTLLRNDIAEGPYDTTYVENKIRRIAYQEAPYPVLWSIDDAGKLYGITRERSQQVSAWHSHTLGGRVPESEFSGNAGADHAACVEDISVTPSPRGDGERLWLMVKREIMGEIVYYLEYIDRYRSLKQLVFPGSNPDNYFFFSDSSRGAYSGTPLNVFTGFTHIAGEVASVVADGKFLGNVTVSNTGTITLPNDATANSLVAGLPYKSRLKTARTEGGSQIGSSNGAIRRVDRISINLSNTRFFKFGFEAQLSQREEILNSSAATQTDAHDSRLEEHSYTDPKESPGDPFYTESGIVTKPAPSGYDDKAVAIILSDRPYPCTVLGITIRAVEADV